MKTGYSVYRKYEYVPRRLRPISPEAMEDIRAFKLSAGQIRKKYGIGLNTIYRRRKQIKEANEKQLVVVDNVSTDGM